MALLTYLFLGFTLITAVGVLTKVAYTSFVGGGK